MGGRRSSASAPLLEWVRRHGCEVVLSRGHYRVTYGGVFVGVFASTPSDRRAMQNSRSFLRRRLREVKGKVETRDG